MAEPEPTQVPDTESQADPYEGMRELYASKDTDERAEMMLHAVSKAQVEAMLSVERLEAADRTNESVSNESPESRMGTEKSRLLESLKNDNPEQYQQIVNADEEEAWRTYGRAQERSQREAIDRARETIHKAEEHGATFTSEEAREREQREAARTTVESQHLDEELKKSTKLSPSLQQRLRQQVTRATTAASRSLRDARRSIARGIFRRP